MITGDAEDTAVAVASAIGFFDPSQHRTLSGAEVEHMSISELEVSLALDQSTPEEQSVEYDICESGSPIPRSSGMVKKPKRGAMPHSFALRKGAAWLTVYFFLCFPLVVRVDGIQCLTRNPSNITLPGVRSRGRCILSN